MNLERFVALSVVEMQPETIQNRLLTDKEFLSHANIRVGTYAGIGEFEHEEIVAALVTAHETRGLVTVRTKKGKSVRLERTSQGVKVYFTDKNEQEQTALISEFSLLDPDPAIRINAYRLMQKEYWPALLGSDKWLTILDSRPLVEAELDLLLEATDSCPKHVYKKIDQKWRSGSINVLDLIPSSIPYYECLIGPPPFALEVDQWISQQLLPYHRLLLDNDLVSGLAFALPTSLHGDITVNHITVHRSNDDMWNAIQEIGQIDTPFALLGVLQIALPRSSDERFKTLAAAVIERLCAPELIGRDGIDTYKLMAPLLALCIRWINIQEGFLRIPPYWRRVAAFLHCHFLLDILRSRKIDLERFPAWCNDSMTHEMIVAELLDMQKEPMWRSLELTPISLRSEVMGRLSLLALEAEANNSDVPNLEFIHSTISELGLAGILRTQFCGPLEGHLRRNKVPDSLIAAENHKDEISKLLACLKEKPCGEEWEILMVNSKLFLFDDSMLGEMARIVSELDMLSGGTDEKLSFLDALTFIALIAASQPSELLATSLATALNRNASKLSSGIDAGHGYQILLTAASTFCDRQIWLDWLEKRLADYAYFLPSGESSLTLLQCLKMLKKLFPVEEWRFARAQMLAAAVMR
jgi:hypothetical protein